MLSNKIEAGVKLVAFKDVLQSDHPFCVDFAGFDKECLLTEDIGNLYYCTDFVELKEVVCFLSLRVLVQISFLQNKTCWLLLQGKTQAL